MESEAILMGLMKSAGVMLGSFSIFSVFILLGGLLLWAFFTAAKFLARWIAKAKRDFADVCAELNGKKEPKRKNAQATLF